MLNHMPENGDTERPERPERLSSILKMFTEFGLDRRLSNLPVCIYYFNDVTLCPSTLGLFYIAYNRFTAKRVFFHFL